MKFSLPTLLLALIVPLSLPAVGADLFDPEDGMLDMSRYLQDNQYGFLPVPVVITEPAVGYGGGLFGLFLHGKGTRDGDHFIPPPITAFGGGGTQNGTWFIGGGHRHTWNNDRIRYLLLLGYANIKLDIYSDGLTSFNKNTAIHSQTRGYGGLQKLLFRVGDTPVFVGASQCMRKPTFPPITRSLIGYGSRCWVRRVHHRRWAWWRNMTLRIIFSILRRGYRYKANIDFSVHC